jgi:hypothetical protein
MKKIKLTRGQFAIVDDGDFKELNKHKWYAEMHNNVFRARRTVIKESGNKGCIYLHSAIMKPPKGMVVDHADHDTLNNQRNNLRICTNSQNNMNKLPTSGHTSKYKGVWWHKFHKKWRARIGINSKKIELGLFRKELDAAEAYNSAAIKLFGEFAYLNKI